MNCFFSPGVGAHIWKKRVLQSPNFIHLILACCLALLLWIDARPRDLAFRNLFRSNSSSESCRYYCAFSMCNKATCTIASCSLKFPMFWRLQIFIAFSVLINLTCNRRIASCVFTGCSQVYFVSSL